MTPHTGSLLKIARVALSRGYPRLFKRIRRIAVLLSQASGERKDYADTDSDLNEVLIKERSDEPPVEIIDADGDGKKEIPGEEEEDEDEDEDEDDGDKEGAFAGFPMGALPTNQNRKTEVNPWEMGVATPKLWGGK